ncbi:MAG: S-ribosylhomocysteine lyase [Clostridioides sp.]|jgi:S-ribosylhomocysteine lyase|nr:S-ribosylhomocysteine lyase [Clostridioides sp.]
MQKIASFEVDHRYINPGVYISRIDGDITTYDLRTRKPNTGDLMTNEAMHSTEHLFATLIRNSKIKDQVIYFGPMGCQTGYYLLVRGADDAQVVEEIKKTLIAIANYEGEMPGKSEIECGNYINLDVDLAKEDVKRYYEEIKDITVEDLKYPEGR